MVLGVEEEAGRRWEKVGRAWGWGGGIAEAGRWGEGGEKWGEVGKEGDPDGLHAGGVATWHPHWSYVEAPPSKTAPACIP